MAQPAVLLQLGPFPMAQQPELPQAVLLQLGRFPMAQQPALAQLGRFPMAQQLAQQQARVQPAWLRACPRAQHRPLQPPRLHTSGR